MSNCSNCFNGCTEIISDRCVKYTGIDVPVLGIQTGDSLSFVEQALITFLVSTLDGTGIKIDLAPTVVCEVVNKYLPTCGDLSIVDISTALIEAVCDLQEQIDAIVADIVLVNDELDIINADYTVGCLIETTPSITPSSGTHTILQATINALCALALDLDTNYVKISQIDNLIEYYLSNISGITTKYYNRMIPFAVVPYFGSLSFFNSQGEGIGDWEKIYICNGNFGTPDLRGRALTGAINQVPGPVITDPVILPGGNNPNYALNNKYGTNEIILDATQIPPLTHTHGNTAVSTVSPNPHTHAISPGATQVGQEVGSAGSGADATSSQNTILTASPTSLSVATTVTINNETLGGGLPHANIQPVVACYYIQYRPS